MPRVSRRSEVDKASSGSLEWRARICAAMLCAAMTASEWPSYCLAATELRAVFTLDFALRQNLGRRLGHLMKNRWCGQNRPVIE